MLTLTRIFALVTLSITLGATSGCTTARPTTRVRPASTLTLNAPATVNTPARRQPTPLAPSPLNKYTIEEDGELGAKMTGAGAFSRFNQAHFVFDAALTGYVRGLFDELLAVAPDYAKKFTYKVQLYRDPDGKNAYAVPGGQIFVSLEIISELPSEGALAGVLAHEMGHVALRHSTAQMTFIDMTFWRKTLIGRLTAPLTSVFTPSEYRLYLLFGEMEERNGTMTPEEHRRRHELEADIFAAQTLSLTRFSAEEFRDWQRERACTCDGAKPHHETHPLYAARASRIGYEMNLCAAHVSHSATPANFALMRHRARMIAENCLTPESILLPPPTIITRPSLIERVKK